MFVKEDNLHEATDVEKIKSLMMNAERLGAQELAEKCRNRLAELQNGRSKRNQRKVPLNLNTAVHEIDLEYWSNKNTYYGEVPINKSMKTAQTKLERLGLVYKFETCDQLIIKIHENIQTFKKREADTLAAEIFDLIQLWGGGMGIKQFYYSGTRFELDAWLPQYLSFISSVSQKDQQNTTSISVGLTKLLEIHGLGMSFATKHLRFWSDLPIFDDRISLLLYAKKAKRVEHYLKFLLDISNIAKNTGLSITTVETSLFAFSQHYFANDKLKIVAGSTHDKDYEIARKIADEISH